MGVVKNIIPAIPSTNAIIAGQCAIEAFKMATMCAKGMDNFMMYNGADGVYTHTVAYEMDPDCPICSPGVAMEVPKESTLSDFIDAVVDKFKDRVALPSISTSNGTNLYMRGVLEEATRDNLTRKMSVLIGEDQGGGEKLEGLIIVNDKKLKGPLRVRLTLT
jgi:ubiquitin-activating enzyme E1 C